MLVLDNKKIEEFSGKMVGKLNTSYLAIMISIGNRTGLFDSLSKMDSSTSNQVAQSSGLNERYVKEM